MERCRNSGTKRSSRSCSCGLLNTSQDLGFRFHGAFKGQTSDADLSILSGHEAKVILRQSLLGEMLLRQHNWIG